MAMWAQRERAATWGQKPHSAWTPPTAETKERHRRGWTRYRPRPHHVLVAILFVAVAVLVLVYFLQGASTYTATISSLDVSGPNQVTATIDVSNLTGAAVTPTCVVVVAGGDRAHGTATFTSPAPIPADQVRQYEQVVAIPNGNAGAVSIGASTVTCH
jgi:hypothetical protein